MRRTYFAAVLWVKLEKVMVTGLPENIEIAPPLCTAHSAAHAQSRRHTAPQALSPPHATPLIARQLTSFAVLRAKLEAVTVTLLPDPA